MIMTIKQIDFRRKLKMTKFNADVAHSNLGFEVKHMMISKVKVVSIHSQQSSKETQKI